MSCPPGASRGCECAVVHVFARMHAFTYLEVKSASSGGGDNTLKGRDTLLEIISEHATSTALPALLRKPPPPALSIVILTVMLRGTFDPLLALYFPLPLLQTDLSLLYLYQVIHQPSPSPPVPLLD